METKEYFEKEMFFRKPTRPSLPLRKAPPFSPQPSSMVFTPPSVPPFAGDRNLRSEGENRPPVLGTASLYGCRTIKGLRHVLRAGTAWGIAVYSLLLIVHS